MRQLAILLALMIAALPVEAGACVLAGPDAAPAALAADAGDAAHDCCPGEEREGAERGPGCDGAGHCGQCVVPGSALPTGVAHLAFERPASAFEPLDGTLAPSHDAPPYRPPIS